MHSLSKLSDSKCFSGCQRVYSHTSDTLKCTMRFGLFLPEQALLQENLKFPLLFFLSGLTCTEENFIQKSGFQRYAAEHNFIVVNPDTSPRGCNIEGEDVDWDFGSGAGFYVDATEEKWAKNYLMYSYVTQELPKFLCENFNVDPAKIGITGHSMGGHGALICALKNPSVFRSVSSFAPVVNPCQCPWGIKAFTGYLGDDPAAWLQYDSCFLAQNYSGPNVDILIDQGDLDKFYIEKQLLTENFAEACSKNTKIKCSVRFQKGYDHGYYFISTFVGDHFAHHAKVLG